MTFHDAVLKETGIDTDKITEKDLKIDGIGLGAKLDNFYKEKVRPKIIEPTFVVDYLSEMIALAKRKENNSKYIASFQLLVNGVELLKAYNELNDPVEQAARWNDETALAKKGAENAMQFDQDYIQALEYGLPPVAGWGMGIDRFVQIITNQPCIKDVIFFPAMRSEEI
ncbi:MAG TPA: hypothetical protein PK131_02175 [Candidatus Woesebacteria bacterium]|nr:hypothetical protein [Candidatus Woesebacteria bacterium]